MCSFYVFHYFPREGVGIHIDLADFLDWMLFLPTNIQEISPNPEELNVSIPEVFSLE